MMRRLLIASAGLWLALLTWAPLARAADEGGEKPVFTWLNWLYLVRYHGRPLATEPAQVAFAWALLLVVILCVAAIVGSRRLAVRPGKFQSLLELGLGALNGIVEGALGKHGADFLPFIGTIFLYVMLMNLMGLLPGVVAPTSSFSTTAALALLIFVVVQFYGLKLHGAGYFKHFLEGLPPAPSLRGNSWPLFLLGLLPWTLMAVLIFTIHIVGELVRPVSLAIRLFGNISGEETVVAALVGLMATTRYFFWVPVQLPNLALGVLTALVQALIMALLAAVYLSGVMPHDEHEPAHPVSAHT